jgi:hypothetical protein
MMPMRPKPFAALIVAFVLALATGLTGPALADLTVKGDAAAWQEVLAANAKLNALPGYRMKVVMAAGQTMVIEFAPGSGAMHSTMQSQSGGMEMVVVGSEGRFRINASGAPAGWRCQAVPANMRPGDPASMQSLLQGTVDIARAPEASIDGKPMRVYVYTVQGGAAGQSVTLKTTLYVGSENGLPRRAAVIGPGAEQTTMDYYDYGAPIQITLPSCGSGLRPLLPAG